MWGMFACAVVVDAACLFLPGIALLRAGRLAWPLACACAPVLSIAAYALLGIAYASLGVRSSWVTMFFPLMIVGLCALAVSRAIGRRGKGSGSECSFPCAPAGGHRWLSDAWCAALYLTVGVVVSAVFFVWFLGAPDAYVQEYDNVSHMGSIRSFVETGVWSPFATSLYAGDAASLNPLPGDGFYPSAWYTVAALAGSALPIRVGLMENAANFVGIATVLPLGVFAFMRMAFPDRPSVVAFGPFVMLAFSAFPWLILAFGPLYPNTLAFCLVPATAACFMAIFAPKMRRLQRVCVAALFCVCLAALALSQPNAVFTLAVLLAPFCVRQAARAADLFATVGVRRKVLQVTFGAAMSVVVVLIWAALLHAPFLQAVLGSQWMPIFTRGQATLDVLSLGLRSDYGSQPVLAALVAVGVVCVLARFRAKWWIVAAYGLSGVMYVFSASSDGPLQRILSGFWYTDPFRMAAMVALFGIPLAALGLWAIAKGCWWLVRRATQCTNEDAARCSGKAAPFLASAVVIALFAVGNYWPDLAMPGSSSDKTSFSATADLLHSENQSQAIYNAEEQRFVRDVLQVVGSDDLVLNAPDDGSAFAYVADGLNAYYRYLRTYGDDNETTESAVIRERLCWVSFDPAVQQAVERVGGTYVLLLDQGDEPVGLRSYLFTYGDGELWQGIESITDETPGFEVVLAEGDMRLYRIVV